jgi:hypothetical protein
MSSDSARDLDENGCGGDCPVRNDHVICASAAHVRACQPEQPDLTDEDTGDDAARAPPPVARSRPSRRAAAQARGMFASIALHNREVARDAQREHRLRRSDELRERCAHKAADANEWRRTARPRRGHRRPWATLPGRNTKTSCPPRAASTPAMTKSRSGIGCRSERNPRAAKGLRPRLARKRFILCRRLRSEDVVRSWSAGRGKSTLTRSPAVVNVFVTLAEKCRRRECDGNRLRCISGRRAGVAARPGDDANTGRMM